ncbi:PadR family transcriptional regulator [Streptomyces sp. Act143]|uniref:PadR family transcriptional regulator n=1 Tax=Streptomyces sp. Act143 TaxID=2200760 RepID=UPI000D67A828|nr:PadR family transcriptional regulator [Streptomyces sp. Act143]PWI15796.1 PadR family transcriptional regulator [Streptomyces sp. Act143]
MPIHHAVLALLSRRPNHGYELKARFEETIGPQWGGLNIGHLYQILERLVRDGYVSRSQVAQTDRPDKTLYTLTPAGETELHTWATTPWVRVGGFRDELFLKLLGAVSVGPEALSTFVESQRQTYLSELAGLGQQRRAHSGEPLVAVLIDAAIAHTKADLGLLDSAARHLGPLAATHGEQAPERPASATRERGDADGHDGAAGGRAESA